MKIKSIYVYAQEKGAGSLFVTMGMMDILKKNIDKVAIFRPIINNKNERDADIDFLLQIFYQILSVASVLLMLRLAPYYY